MAVVAPLTMRQPVTYSAIASIQAQAAEPQADTQVAAILSQVTAIATSPSLVQNAITATGAHLDALTVARHDITVSSLGTSAVVTVTVTEAKPQVAMRLTNALASGIVNKLNGLGTQSASELADLAAQRSQLTGQMTKLLTRLASTRQPGTSAIVQGLIAQLNAVESQLTVNSTSVQQVLSNSTVNEGAGVISPSTYAQSQSRHVATECALAGLLGLVVGLIIATIRELSWPTLADPGAAARELSLVLVGRAQVTKDDVAVADSELAIRLDMAAHRLGAGTLVLTGPVPPGQLSALARHLNDTVAAAELLNSAGPHAESARVTSLPAHPSPGTDTRSPTGSFGTVSARTLSGGARHGLVVTALPDLTLRARPEDPALVLVLPRFAPRAALDQAVDLGVTTGWPLLGVIGLRQVPARRLQQSAGEDLVAGEDIAEDEDLAESMGSAGSARPGSAPESGGKTHVGVAL